MNPVAAVLIVAAGAGVALAARKRSTAAAKVDEYWAWRRQGGSPLVILREWAVEGNPELGDAEIDALIDQDFLFARAQYLVDLASGVERTAWGLDIFSPENSTVHAAKSGIVSLVTGTLAGSCGKGNYVGISHLTADGESTFYSNLRYIDVGVGQIVRGGDRIGSVGRTNFCESGAQPAGQEPLARPRLHFEIHEARVPSFARPAPGNPLNWLAAQEIAPYLREAS